MLTKRIIPCLDIKDGRTVKGVNFEGLRDAGDPVELAIKYAKDGADELVFLDITATIEKRKTLIELVSKIAQNINIPFTVGGGINDVESVETLLKAGADKVSINSAAVRNPQLLNQLSEKFGNQCMVLAIDAKKCNSNWKVFLNGGQLETERELIEWAKEGVERGAGEILFTSMNNDGVKTGFALEPLKLLCDAVNVPVIASGGAGGIKDFEDVFTKTNVDAALAASIFHFNEVQIPFLKTELLAKNISIRP